MKAVLLVALNLVLVGLFVFILKKRELLTYYRSGRLWLTWLAIVFIAVTSILIRFMSTRFVEIAEVLEHQNFPAFNFEIGYKRASRTA
jgi:energy-coupling factor transporter transmembrane protein EcfT